MDGLDVIKARGFAIEKHGEQMYGSYPYIYHLDMVNSVAEMCGLSVEHRVLAYLHDTIEDDVSTYKEISEFFGSDMGQYVSRISRDKDNETYTVYIERIKYYGGLVRELKICDLLCNLEECNKNPVGKNIGRSIRYTRALVLLGG